MCRIICVLLILCLTTACARQTMILSEPSDARVIINGQEVCMTPCAYTYNTGRSKKSYDVVLRKEGYLPLQSELKSDEVDTEARKSLWTAGMMIPGGSLLWIGTIFTNRLKESYSFILHEENEVVSLREQEFGD